MTRFRPAGALAAIAVIAALATGCAGSPASTATGGATETAGVPTSPVATPDPTDSSGAVIEPTCETIIPDATAKDFADLGWTGKQEPFVVGDTTLSGGLQCTWGDYSVPSDHVQVFGWAPIDDDQAGTARKELLASGWRVVEGTDGALVTENPDTAAYTDDEGFGLTYQFGDGWVKLADTKQGLLLVEWPRS